MKKIINYLNLLLAAGWLVACNAEEDLVKEQLKDNPESTATELTGEAGSADFSTYVSVGNSITAGLMDAALYTRGQSGSFPNLLAARFALAGGGDFVQPDIEASNGFNISYNDLANAFTGPATYGRLYLDLSALAPAPTSPGDVMNVIASEDRASINNLAVPGLRMLEYSMNGYAPYNPFYYRFALDVTSTSVLEQTIARDPTFITFWLGSNDVLSWATSGGTAPDGEDNPGVNDADADALVSTTYFQQALSGSLAALFASNEDLQGVICNIPNVTLLPYFQAVSWDVITLSETYAETINTAFGPYNAVLQALTDESLSAYGITPLTAEEAAYRSITFAAGANAVVIEDDALSDLGDDFDILQAAGAITEAQRTALEPFEQARQLKSVSEATDLATYGLPAEILLLPSANLIGTLADADNALSIYGIGVPLSDEYSLTVDEIATLVTRIVTFNAMIEAQANAYENLYLFDAYSLFISIAQSGYATETFTYQPDFSPNGIFSVDGIHPNPAGHAIIANEIMKVIENGFEADLPEYDISEFTTVLSQ